MTYDHITDQFTRDLSPLARRMYAAIWGTVSDPRNGLSVELRHLDKANEKAMMELIRSGLIEVVIGTPGHRRLTSAAWRAHLLAERAEREKPKEQAPAKPPSSLGNCANCGIELDNVTTGMVVVHRENRHITVCGPCADSLVARKLYTIVAQAKSLTAESAAALLRDAVEGRR
jgi:hypothetical protein